MLAGCVQDRWYRPVNRATIRVLARNGWRVVVPPGQASCWRPRTRWTARPRPTSPPRCATSWSSSTSRASCRRRAPRCGGCAARPLPPAAHPADRGGAAGGPPPAARARSRRGGARRSLLRRRRPLQRPGARDGRPAQAREGRGDRGHGRARRAGRQPWLRHADRRRPDQGAAPARASSTPPSCWTRPTPGSDRRPAPHPGQARWSPGLPSSITKEAAVSTGAPGRDTYGRTHRSVRQVAPSRWQRR